MSRSVHTRPRKIRACDRLRQPRKPRGQDDLSGKYEELRALKELGLPSPDIPSTDQDSPSSPNTASSGSSWSLPAIVETRPRPGYHHPANKADIARVLRFFGEEYVYGLRVIELQQTDPTTVGPRLGRLTPPGRIVLYEQLQSPWHLSGRIDDDERRRLETAGARVESAHDLLTITWPDDTLREFMMIDVLMHEVGHHLLQHHKGKRLARVARTRDHELFADTLARRCREIYESRGDVRQ